MKKFKVSLECEKIINAENELEALKEFWDYIMTWAAADIEEIEENN